MSILNFENYITERVVRNIDSDVDYLYSFFKKDVEEINRTGILTKDMFNEKHTIYSNELESKKSIKADLLNPCRIVINHDYPVSNFYSPKGGNIISKNITTIGLSINKSSIKLILNDFNGDIKKANKTFSGIEREFKGYKIRGSIRHELVHWYDDTLHNKNIQNILKGDSLKKHLKKKNLLNVNSMPFEIYSIVQNIYELYQKHKEQWDDMTFNDMVKLSPALNGIKERMGKTEYNRWKNIIKGKMYRDDILGKNMINT